jgi:hypothetical protein
LRAGEVKNLIDIYSQKYYSNQMHVFSRILSDLRAAIAVVAARERSLSALLVIVWGRVSRVGVRIERLLALWRAGKLPAARAPRVREDERAAADVVRRPRIPSGRGWLALRAWEVRAFGSQLAHLIATDAEFARFLAEVPQAARILRPICRMLLVDELPVVLRKVRVPAVVDAAMGRLVPAGVVAGVGVRKNSG